MLGVDMHVEWLGKNVIARGLGSLLPGTWLGDVPERLASNMHTTGDLGGMVTQSWLTLSSPGMWLGVLAGVAMIYAAIQLRRWKDEG